MPPKKNSVRLFKTTGQDQPARQVVLSNQDVLELGAKRFEFMFDHFLLPKTFSLPSGEITANQAFCEMLGYSRAELQGKKWQDITHPDDLAISRRANKSLATGEKDSVRLTKRYLHKSGAVVWAEVSACVRQDETGQALYFITEITDITGCKLAEEALNQSEEKFRLLSENSLNGIYIIQDNKMVYTNPSLAEMFGLLPEEIVNQPIPIHLIHPDDLQAALGRIKERLDGMAEKGSATFKTFKKDGSGLSIEVYGTSIEYQGRPAVMGTILDVTERSRASEARRASEERLREVLENSLDASYKRDLKTNRYEYLSPVFTRLSGYGLEEMKILSLESILELIHPDDLPEVNRRLAEALSGAPGTNWHVEYRFKHKSGQYCWFQDRFTIMRDSNGQPVALIGSVSDVNDRKEAEEALLQKMDELERFQHLTVGRELRMIEMKKEINALLVQSGQPEKYPLPPES